jgi:hypothetical protein
MKNILIIQKKLNKMKIMKFFLSAVTVISFSFSICSCKNQKEANSSLNEKTKSNTMNNVVQLSDTSHYSLLVSFFSIGSGIDFKIAQEYDRYIKQFELENEGKILVERIPWGREGELDYCIRFAGLSPEKQQSLIDRTKDIASQSKWVNVSTDSPCRRKRK